MVEETRQMSQALKHKIKAANSNTGGDKGKKQQVKGVKEQFVGLLGEYQVRIALSGSQPTGVTC